MAALAFSEALKRPDVVKGQFDLLYASLLGDGDGEEEQRPGREPDYDCDGLGTARRGGGSSSSSGSGEKPGAVFGTRQALDR